MQLKAYSILFLTALLLACKPSVQAAKQSSSTALAPTSELNEVGVAGTSLENHIVEEDKQWRKDRPKGVTQAFYICIKENNYVAIEITNCASDEKDIQDARLNRIYKELLAKKNGEQKAVLVEAQRHWLAWKEKEELFETTVYGSEQIDNAELEFREMDRLAKRADELEHYKENIEFRIH